MFERILTLFQGEAATQLAIPDADANHAFGALMVRVAKADKAYLFEELERIDLVLAQHMKINPVQAAKFRAECERLEEAMPDTAALGQILADEISTEEREDMFSALWAVLIADGLRHRDEEAVVNDVAAIFSISPERSRALIASQEG